MLDDAFVHSFVAATDQDKTRFARVFLGHPLTEQPTLRREQCHVYVRDAVRYSLDRSKQGLGFHHHSGAAAKRPIVNLTMPVVGVVAQIVNMNLNQVRFDRTPNYSKIKDPAEDLREDRY